MLDTIFFEFFLLLDAILCIITLMNLVRVGSIIVGKFSDSGSKMYDQL